MNENLLKALSLIGQKEHRLSRKWKCFEYRITSTGDKSTLVYSLSPKGRDWQRNEDVLFSVLDI